MKNKSFSYRRAGFIGSYFVDILINRGEDVVKANVFVFQDNKNEIYNIRIPLVFDEWFESLVEF